MLELTPTRSLYRKLFKIFTKTVLPYTYVHLSIISFDGGFFPFARIATHNALIHICSPIMSTDWPSHSLTRETAFSWNRQTFFFIRKVENTWSNKRQGSSWHKQPSRGFLKKRSSENMQQIYRRTPLLCNIIEIALRHGCSPVNLLHILRTYFLKIFG